MLESGWLTILAMAVVVFLTRAAGYAFGLVLPNVGRLQSVLEVLPGCAMMGLIVPGMMRGSVWEMTAVVVAGGIMWKTGSVVWATLIGISLLIGFDAIQ